MVALLIFIAWLLCCFSTGQCYLLQILAKGCTNIMNEITTREQHEEILLTDTYHRINYCATYLSVMRCMSIKHDNLCCKNSITYIFFSPMYSLMRLRKLIHTFLIHNRSVRNITLRKICGNDIIDLAL